MKKLEFIDDPGGSRPERRRTMKKARSSQITRREFVGGTLAVGALAAGAPAILRGQNLNSKLDIAFIAAGGRANASLNELTIEPGRKPSGREPDQYAGPHPDENVVVLCDIDQNYLDAASKRFPKAKTYKDLRRVFDNPDAYDAVVISVAEQTHAVATYLALTLGKHVYCEKPLTYNIQESRLIGETARKNPHLSTQTGNQGHASESRRTVKEILDTGVIGPVHEVHVWADRAWGLQDLASAKKFDERFGFYEGTQIVDRFKEEFPIPEHLSWDLWLGPAPWRPYHPTYFPGPRWYRWWDFANGTMSDLGGHDNDVPYMVLDLFRPDGKGGKVLAPLTVESYSPNVPVAHKELTPATMRATYEFPAVGSQPALKLVWYQGDLKPPGWEESWGGRSNVFIGENGKLIGGRNIKLLPEEKFKDFKMPPKTLPRSPGHWVEWVNFAKGNGPRPGAHFGYTSWTTEANHLGNVAYRTGKKIEWDWENMKATNAPEADPFIKRPEYRKGWDNILKF